jgi:RNA polymerase sigma factor for flagellar operon FliA
VRQVRAALEDLPERDALILSLYYVEDFSYVEIGEVLGVSESRVCQLHARALTRLRAVLVDADDEAA